MSLIYSFSQEQDINTHSCELVSDDEIGIVSFGIFCDVFDLRK
jgi:hypothetical protein